jgi:O-6-methylguanine DNA methyltransferase
MARSGRRRPRPASKQFRAACRTAVVTVAGERLRVAWTSTGIAAVERETLRARRQIERRTKMDLVDAPAPLAVRQFLALAAKGRGEDAPLDLSWARDFERDVIDAARRIPYGETRSYSWLAREARRPLAVRAAASAMARNPLWLLVPCHRVIYADGRLGPYGNGTVGSARKRALLAGEGVMLKSPAGSVRKRSTGRGRSTH